MNGRLFTEGTIGKLKLPNRIVMSAMHLGLPLEREAAFLAERAKGGAALVTTVMGIAPAAAPADMPVICEDNREKICAMADKVHKAGGLLSVQLFHVGRNCEAGGLADPSAKPSAPSPVPSPIYRSVPGELTEDDIEEIYTWFARAAALCKKCGVDTVEVSSSAGYLLSEFLSALTNLRRDEYGGDFEHRAKMPLGVIKSVRRAVGRDYPVILRISAADMLGGYGISEMRQFVGWASPEIDAVSVTGGWHESPVPQISMDLPEGGFAFLAKSVRRAASVPVIACNRIVSGETAERLLQEEYCDFVGCARAFLIDSGFAEKIKNNIPYLKCIGCNKGCIEQVLKHRPATCVFNPAVGREEEGVPAAKVKKRVLVVGGGPAGLYAATYLARGGHEVTLCNREEEWGGLLRYASLPPHKQAIAHNVTTMIYRAKQAGVTLLNNTEADEKFLENHLFDYCVLAEGCHERIPRIEGDDTRRVYLAREIFEADRELMESLAGKNICIIGGGSQAVELALYVLGKTEPDRESGCFLERFVAPSLRPTLNTLGNITIVEMTEKIARDLGSTRWILMKQLERYPVELMTGSTVQKITPNGVEIRQGDAIVKRPADVIILAVGYVPRDGVLIRCLEERGIPFLTVGDGANQGKGIMSATRSAWEAAAALGGD